MSREIEIKLRSDEVIDEDRSFNKLSIILVPERFRISESFSRKFSLTSKLDGLLSSDFDVSENYEVVSQVCETS